MNRWNLILCVWVKIAHCTEWGLSNTFLGLKVHNVTGISVLFLIYLIYFSKTLLMAYCPNNTSTVTLTHGNQCWIKLVNTSTVLFLLCACSLIAGGTVLCRRWVLGTAGCSADFLVPAVWVSVFDNRRAGRNLTPKAKINRNSQKN